MQVDKKNGSICYNDDAHVYWDGDTNKKYISVTTLLEKYIPPLIKNFGVCIKLFRECSRRMSLTWKKRDYLKPIK